MLLSYSCFLRAGPPSAVEGRCAQCPLISNSFGSSMAVFSLQMKTLQIGSQRVSRCVSKALRCPHAMRQSGVRAMSHSCHEPFVPLSTRWPWLSWRGPQSGCLQRPAIHVLYYIRPNGAHIFRCEPQPAQVLPFRIALLSLFPIAKVCWLTCEAYRFHWHFDNVPLVS